MEMTESIHRVRWIPDREYRITDLLWEIGTFSGDSGGLFRLYTTARIHFVRCLETGAQRPQDKRRRISAVAPGRSGTESGNGLLLSKSRGNADDSVYC